ncbi:MspA family porin [Gordonia zhaorongruii]|uniref:MspA family porin n=1 Tax=Gordonia zhaorongruii TaxID=2597659 RepID=UPI00117D0C88|nr:MspA family porin [Gordonia zhaorongruii]
MSDKTTSIARRAAVATTVAAVAATGLIATAGDANAGRLPSGSKTSTGIDGQTVKLKRSGESVVRQRSVANNGAGRSAAVSGTYKATLSKGKGLMQVGYLVGCQIDITGLEGGLSGTIATSPSLSGSLSVPLKPGEVKFVKGDKIDIKEKKATVMVSGFQLNVQQCGGHASARSIVKVIAGEGYELNDDDELSFDGGVVQSTLYGKPFSLG